jgi:hypothetical protein
VRGCRLASGATPAFEGPINSAYVVTGRKIESHRSEARKHPLRSDPLVSPQCSFLGRRGRVVADHRRIGHPVRVVRWCSLPPASGTGKCVPESVGVDVDAGERSAPLSSEGESPLTSPSAGTTSDQVSASSDLIPTTVSMEPRKRWRSSGSKCIPRPASMTSIA